MWKCTTVTVLVFTIILIFLHIKRKEFSDNIINPSQNDTAKKIKQHIPKFMLDLYHQNVNGTEFKGPDILRSVIPKTGSSYDDIGKQKHFLIFDIPKAKKDEEFYNAELRILTFIHHGQDINKILKISIHGTNNSLLYIDKILINPQNNTWISINLTNPVQTLLLQNPSNHLKIFIYMNSQYRDIKLTLMPKILTNYDHNYPVLLLSYNLKKSRAKRSVLDEDFDEENSYIWKGKIDVQKGIRAKNGCRKKPLYINFAEIQYDTWIVQPSGYEAFQCLGKCYYPVAEHLSPTKHAIVQALLHSVYPLKASRSCCVPTKLDPISVLYIDSKGVLTYRYAYKDMVVSTCGCR